MKFCFEPFSFGSQESLDIDENAQQTEVYESLADLDTNDLYKSNLELFITKNISSPVKYYKFIQHRLSTPSSLDQNFPIPPIERLDRPPELC